MTTRLYFFFFNDTATTDIYTLSLHDALPILKSSMCALRLLPGISPSGRVQPATTVAVRQHIPQPWIRSVVQTGIQRSEEHTSELQSRGHLVCRLLLEKKKKITKQNRHK